MKLRILFICHTEISNCFEIAPYNFNNVLMGKSFFDWRIDC